MDTTGIKISVPISEVSLFREGSIYIYTKLGLVNCPDYNQGVLIPLRDRGSTVRHNFLMVGKYLG